jgi:hypothetical protein
MLKLAILQVLNPSWSYPIFTQCLFTDFEIQISVSSPKFGPVDPAIAAIKDSRLCKVDFLARPESGEPRQRLQMRKMCQRVTK